MGFKKVDVKTLEMKPFEKIGSEWMLISAAKDGKANTMTASWGGIGVLWGKKWQQYISAHSVTPKSS